MAPTPPTTHQQLRSTKAQFRRNLAGWLWISPWLVGFIAFMLIPMALSLYYSFCDYPLLEPPLFTGLDNYKAMLSDELFLSALWRTTQYCLLFIPLATVLSLVIAGLLNQKVKAGGFFQAAVFLPTLVPMAASAMVWLWLFNGQYGLINRALALVNRALPFVHIKGPGWLTEQSWAMPAILIISLWGIGQAVVVYLAAMKEVPDQLYEAAALDGMGPIRRFTTVTLPMISPVILFNVITLLIGSMQVFAIPYIIAKAAPGGNPRAMYFYTMYMYDNAFVYGKMGYASAQAWLQLVIVLVLTALTFFFSKKFVHYRGA